MIGTNSRYPSPLIVPCTKCGSDIKLYTHHRAASYCCVGCGSYYLHDLTGSPKINYSFTKSNVVAITFKPGMVFRIEGMDFVLVNFITKEETSYKTQWTEYSLFHPTQGYWTLSESDGHYSLMKPVKYYLPLLSNAKSIDMEDKGKFLLYNKYKFKVKNAGGEFIYNILDKNLPACADFVNAPYVLSYEKSSDEILWFLGEYATPRTVKDWVQEDVELPAKEGIAPNQPFSLNFDHTSLIRLSVIACIVLILCQVFLSSFVTTSKQVSKQTFFQTDSLAQRTYVSSPFTISGNNCATDFKLDSYLQNNWVEADFTLVNETTGDQYYFSGALEYYSGYTDGESWSEGSNNETLTVGHLKKGTYHFNVTVANDLTKPFKTLSVAVIENVDLISNFLITLLCLIVFPVYIYYRRRRFDRKQWYNSDYTPYDYE